MNPKKTSDPLISGPKVAHTLDLDPATVRRYKKEGCPCHVIGEGLIRYRLSEVLAWRAQRKTKSVAA